MKKVKLSELVGITLTIEYPSESFKGEVTCDIINKRPYYHFAFRAKAKKYEKEEDCIKTVYLREGDFWFSDEDKNKLISKKDFYPIWTHFRNETEYKELEKVLNEN